MKIFRPQVIVGTLPSTLTNGTTADATQVMADLNFIVSQVNGNAAPLAGAAVTTANNNFTTVQSGQAATQVANFPIASQIQNNSLQTLSSVLGTNTLTARVSAIPLGAYVAGQVFSFLPTNQNNGAATINIDGLGAKSILSAGSSLSGAELQTWKPAFIGYDGGASAFDLLNGTPCVQGPNIPSATTINLDGSPGDYHHIDGTTNITGMTLSRGREKLLVFNSSPLVSHSASLNLGSNISPSIGTVMRMRGEAGSVVRMVGYRGPMQGQGPKITVLTSGSGLYIPTLGTIWVRVRMVGGGGASQTRDSGGTYVSGGNGGDTTFWTFTAGGGKGGDASGNPAAGGTSSGGSINLQGGPGGVAVGSVTSGTGGGGSVFGSVGAGISAIAGVTNTGMGGSGGFNAAGGLSGGAAGGYLEGVISYPTAITYAVGAAGAVNPGAGGGTQGAAGGSGVIILEEHFG